MTLWELSHAQKRIWYAQQKYPGSPLFSIGGMAIAASELETSTLENAIVRLVRTQQALRLRFREENGAVFQYVDDTASPLVSVQYFSASADGEDALRAWCLEPVSYTHLLRAVQHAIDRGMGHISLYKLVVFAYTKLYKDLDRRPSDKLPDAESCFSMFRAAHRLLLQSGYTLQSVQEYGCLLYTSRCV